MLFNAPTGEKSQAQIEAFEDTWHWNDHAENAFDEVMQSSNEDVADTATPTMCDAPTPR